MVHVKTFTAVLVIASVFTLTAGCGGLGGKISENMEKAETVASASGLTGEGPGNLNIASATTPTGAAVKLNWTGAEGTTVKVKDSEGALIWTTGAKKGGAAKFRVPHNAEPGTYVAEAHDGSRATFKVNNPRMENFTWRETDADLRETYTYPSIIGPGSTYDESPTWRTDKKFKQLATWVLKKRFGSMENVSRQNRSAVFKALTSYTAGAIRNPSGNPHRDVESPSSQCRKIDEYGEVRGDCSESAVLLVALTRSVGIPARYVMDGGLNPYSGGGDTPGALKGHSWAEARIGGEWVMADPSPRKNESKYLWDAPAKFVNGSMVTVPAAYVPSGKEYLHEAPVRSGWVNNEDLAERYLSNPGYLTYDLPKDTRHYDVKFYWNQEGEKVILQTRWRATPKLYASKISVSDGKYFIKEPGKKWREVPLESFEKP